jgi:D-aspartate ligase
MGAYYGTLAAVRSLGRAGVPVIVADAKPYAPAVWSRYATKRLRCPRVRSVDAFLDWLLDRGTKDPGHVLYATCDDLAWVFALYEPELSKHFKLLTPSFDTMKTLLDKGALYSACNDAGLLTPRTWLPTSRQDVERLASQGPPSLILKPRTQVLFNTMRKGSIVTSAAELEASYEEFRLRNQYDHRVLEHQPEVGWPMLQEFCGAPGDPVYSVSGFCDSRHGLFVARGTYKLLQWPRNAGVGILFEDAPVEDEVARRIQKMCQKLGFFGVFEAEFVRAGNELRLIDFNPRFFGQMGFDVARALPSPLLVYLAATGDIAKLKAAVERARQWRAPGPMRFANQTAIGFTRTVERVVGVPLDPWTNGAAGPQFDAARDLDDWLPGVLDGVQVIADGFIHPRAMLRAAMGRD